MQQVPPEELPPPLETPPARPPRRSRRLWCAYWVTFRVVLSYLWFRLIARLLSPAAQERALARCHARNARRIDAAIRALQGLYIKVGQLISIMTNFLPAEFRGHLEGLQDQVPPRPYPDIERRLREELGRPPGELFARFDERPIAAASIGQVHVAELRDGATVAVKVQYPDIEETVRLDLGALRRIFGVIGFFFPFQGLDAVFEEIRLMLLEELDFRIEADNVRRIAKNFAGRADVGFAEPVPELSTARVLTTRWQRGVKVSDVRRLDEAGIDRRRLARQIVEAYCQQIFVDGIYHADPHPGNILVRACGDGPCVVFLDFGATAEVSPKMRGGIVELIQGALARDSRRIVAAMRTMGFIARDADPVVFDRIIDTFHERFQQEIQLESFSLREIKLDPEKLIANLADLRRIDVSLRDLSASFHVPKEWIFLERTLLLIMGLCTTLDPEMNPMEVVRPYLQRFVLGPESDWQQLVMSTSKELVTSALALPGELRRFLGTAARGGLEMSAKNVDDAALLVYRLGHQLIYFAGAVAAVAFALVLEGRGDPRARWAWWGGAGAATLLAGSFWATRGWLRRKRRR